MEEQVQGAVSADDITTLAADAIVELDDVIEELEDEEVLVLLFLAKRIRDGQLRYGPFDLRNDARDWRREIREEIADANIYGAAESVGEELKSRFKTDPAPAPEPEKWGVWLRNEQRWAFGRGWDSMGDARKSMEEDLFPFLRPQAELRSYTEEPS